VRRLSLCSLLVLVACGGGDAPAPDDSTASVPPAGAAAGAGQDQDRSRAQDPDADDEAAAGVTGAEAEAGPDGDTEAAGGETDDAAGPDADGWTRGAFESGDYEVAWRVVEASEPPVNDYFTLEVDLWRMDGDERVPLEGAELDVRATMPEHRHGMNTRPVPEEVGDGRYTVPAMLFHMEGYWVLHLSVRTGPGAEDVERANFDLQVG